MCGINGILRLDREAPPVDRGELERTRDFMLSRGPDGCGTWFSPRGDIGLGHRRLAIIDLSEAGAQPMVSADGRCVVVFNGEIYNYRELRRELEAKGYPFRSHSDTEVILALYARYGRSFLSRLRGMYAFALWNDAERRLLLARDPYGIKPLYYAVQAGTLRFASQVRALVAGGAVSAEIDDAGLVGFLLWGSVPEPFTFRRSIRALQAGYTMEVVDGRLCGPQPHCDLTSETPAEVHDPVAAAEDSIRSHVVADVPVGVFLSAGLDSALITALVRRTTREPPVTFTLAFDEFRGGLFDEAPGAAHVARALGTHHVERRVTRDDFGDLWSAALSAMDQPSIDGFNTYMVSRFAREAGMKVVLSGLGGDELLGGYSSFADVPRCRRWASAASHVPGLPKAWSHLAPRLRPDMPKLAALLRYGPTLPGAYFLRRAVFLPEELPDLLGPDRAKAGLEIYDPVADTTECLDPANEDPWLDVHAMESTQYMRNQLLRDADWASMGHSLELRVPLVDVRLRRALLSQNFEPARSGGKASFVRRVAPELPEEVFRRAKSGFMVPVSTLLGREPSRRWGLESRWLAGEVLRAFGVGIEDPRSGTSSSWAVVAGRMRSTRGGTLFLAPEAFRPGGIQRYNRDQVEAIRRCERGAPLSVLLLNNRDEEARQEEWVGLARVRGFARHKLQFSVASFRGALRQRPRRIIIGHRNFLPLAPLLRGVAPASSRWLLIYGIDARPPLKWNERLALRYVDRIFAISPATAAAFREAGCTRPIELWPCSLSFSWTMPEPAAPRFAPPHRLLAVTRLASPERYKGIDHTLLAVADLRRRGLPVILDVVGDGADLQLLRQLATDLGVRDVVTFRGSVNDDALRDLYSACDLFVLPSGDEGFGIVYLEALAYAKPVIAANAAGAPYVVRPGLSGFLVPFGDPAALAASIAQRIESPEEARQVGLSGRHFLLENFSFEAMMRRTRAILEEGEP